MFWGGLNGLALCADKLAGERKKGGVRRALGIALTFCFITFTWIFFRADSFAGAWAVIKGLFTLQQGVKQPFSWSFIAIAALICATVVAEIKAKKTGSETHGYYPILNLDSIPGLTVFFIVVGLILALAYTGDNPFVYFRF